MKTKQLAAIISTLTLTLLSAGAQVREKPLRMGRTNENTFVGLISDSSCGAKHKMADKSAEECARACIHDGSGYVLVAADSVFRLKGHTQEVDALAGQKAKIIGELRGNVITVTTVSATP
jgi:hypothetical protein